MWIARNKDGGLRLFEFPPRRFHEGPMLSPDLIGFNDAVSLGDDDCYSFWAVPEYVNGNAIKSYGLRFYTERYVDDKESIWAPYTPEDFKDLEWEDEPVEVEIIVKKK